MLKKLYLSLTLLTAFLWLGTGTMWGAQTILEEDFETATVEANGWTRVSCYSQSQNYSTAAHSGLKGFRFYYNTNPPQYLVSKELSIPASASAVSVSFYYKNYSTTYPETFQVGYSTTTSETTAFTWDPTDSNITASDGAWHQYTNDAFPVGTKYIAIKYTANNQYYLFIDDLKVECSVSGPAMSIFDGETALTSGYTHNFGLATAGDTKTFTLKNDGTEATPVSVSHTGNFGASLSAASIPAGGEITLTVTMPASTGTDKITISSSSPAIDDFVLNVRGTIADPSKFTESLLGGSKPAEWTTSGTWSWSTTNGASSSAWYESSNYRLYTPKLIVADGESFFVDIQGTSDGYQGAKIEYSTDGSTWTASSTALTITSSWQKFEINDIPAGTYYIAIHGWKVNVRNFYGGVLPNSPKNVQATNIVTEGATITWTPYGSETAWQVSYSTTSGDPANGTLVSATSTSKELSGLTTGTTYYVSVRLDNGNGTYGMWSEETSFTPTCPAPTSPAISAIATTTATASWNAAAGITTYQYIVVEEGEEENWDEPKSVNNATTAALSGLTAETSYDFYVRSFYSEGKVSASAKTTFETACNPKSILPYTCGFESTDQDAFANNGYNNCWKRIGAPAAYTNSTYKHTGSNSLRFIGTDEQYAILPVFAQLVKGMQISFWYFNYFPTSYASTLTLGTMTDPTDPSTFTTIRALDASSSYANIIEESLAGAGANDYYIAFKYTGSNQYSAIYLDDITVEVLPSCPKPTAVEVSNVTGTTADIDWTSSASAWKLQYSTDGSNWVDANEGNNITSKPYTLTGLTPNKTTYYVHVMADCGAGDVSAWSNASDPFQTECADITVDADHDWTENFNNQTVDQLPACWTAAGNTSAVVVKASSSYLTLSSKALYFSGGSGTEAIAILPDFTTDVNTLQIAFSHVEESTSSSGKVRFGYYKDAAFTALKTCDYSTSSSAWKDEAAFAITGVPSGAKLAFAYKPNNTNYTAAVDNIVISLAASCAVPSEVAGEGLSTSTASISWTAGGEETAWKLQYSTDGENWTNANGGNNITDNPYELTGLSAGTLYYARVKADCGGSGLSSWSTASAAFKTDCEATNMPLEEAFASDLPECWRMNTVGDKEWVSTTSYKVSASYSMQFSAYTESENYSELVTPAKNLTEDANLKFYLKNDSYIKVTGEVYVVTSSETIKLFDFPATFGWELQTIDLSDYTGQTVKFIFRGHGNNKAAYSYVNIDDVEVKAKPCDAPTALNVAASSSDATITWTDATNDKWNLRWREVTDPESVWTDVEDLTVKSYTISSGLAVGKTYEVQVQTECSDTKQSAWYPATAQTFELVCNAPTGLAVTARTQNSATFSWTSSETAWKLQYKAEGEADWSEENVTTNPFTLTGLSAGTSYQAQIQSACGSAFTDAVSFTTWCDSKLSLPVELTSFNAIPACWEESPAGAITISQSKLCFVGEGERFLYLSQTAINLNLLSVTLTFSGSLELGYISEPNGAFTSLVASPVSGTEYDLATLAPEAAKYLAIRYNGANNWAQSAISAVNIRKTPGCAKLDAPTATPGVGSASISWTAAGETAWNLQYKLASATDWTDATGEIASPFALNNLEQGVSYKVRVQANCGEEGTGDWSDETTFTTDCDAIDALPFYADFTQALSSCWTIHAGSSYYTPAVNIYSQDLQISGGKSGNSDNVVAMPAISADLTNAVISFEYRGSTSSNYAQLEVGYLTDKSDASTFQSLQVLDQASTYTEARVAVNGLENKYLAFKYAGGSSQGDQYIKNLRVINAYNLADNVDNSATLAALNGQTVDVTIGRTLVAADYYNTLCLPFDVPTLAGTPLAGGDLWAFKYAKVDEATDELLFRIIESDHIEAGVPYFIAFPDNAENIVNPLFKNVTISATAGQEVGNDVAKLCGIVAKPVVFAAHDETKLFLAANNTLYWWDGAEDSQLNSFRAYFKVSVSTPSVPSPARHGMRARIIKEDQEEQIATGINNTNLENVTIKFIENNQVVIIRNGVKYNIQGQVIQ